MSHDMQWRKCSEVMPPIGVQVIAYGPGRGDLIGGIQMDFCVWSGDRWWDEGGTEPVWRDTAWTHWMPIPPVPTEAGI